MLAGGADVDPASYGAEPHPETRGTWPERDRFELGAGAAGARARACRVLGICRGMQMLNVALGGTLDQHLPESSATSATAHIAGHLRRPRGAARARARSPPGRPAPSGSRSSPTTTRGSTGSARACVVTGWSARRRAGRGDRAARTRRVRARGALAPRGGRRRAAVIAALVEAAARRRVASVSMIERRSSRRPSR